MAVGKTKTTKSRELRLDLRAVVYPHGKWWIAHCLEMDLVAEGNAPAQALKDLMELTATQIEVARDSGSLESIFRPAPPEIWTMFSFSREVDLPRVRRRLWRSVKRFEAREAVLA
jgi:hypothetical protein